MAPGRDFPHPREAGHLCPLSSRKRGSRIPAINNVSDFAGRPSDETGDSLRPHGRVTMVTPSTCPDLMISKASVCPARSDIVFEAAISWPAVSTLVTCRT